MAAPQAGLRLAAHPTREPFMRLVAAMLVLLALLAPTHDALAQAQAPGAGPEEERAAVAEVLRQYLRVTDFRDRSAIARSFHPAAVLNSASRAGTLKAMTQDEWWDRVSRIPADTPPRQSKVVLIEVVGVAAMARIDITDARGNSSSDLLTLQKTADGWRIVNKVLSVPL